MKPAAIHSLAELLVRYPCSAGANSLHFSPTRSVAFNGHQVVEAYLKTPQKDGLTHSLAGFQRVYIPTGQSRDVSIAIDPRALSRVDDLGNRSILPGKYTLTMAGAQPQETQTKSEAAFTITGTLPLLK
jgi:beta-glucosidase